MREAVNLSSTFQQSLQASALDLPASSIQKVLATMLFLAVVRPELCEFLAVVRP